MPSILPTLGRIEPRWSRSTITPAREDSDDDEACRVTLVVATSLIADGTRATLRVRHCASGVVIPGLDLDGLEVRDDRVIVTTTGEPPTLRFTPSTIPWALTDHPFFYFEAVIEGRAIQTPRDARVRPDECLRLILRNTAIACVYSRDTTAFVAGTGLRLPALTSTAPEVAAVVAILDGVAGSGASSRILDSYRIPSADLGALLRSTAVVHLATHGLVVHRTEDRILQDEPPDDLDPADWRALVVLTPDLLCDKEIQKTTLFPGVPRHLLYLSACLAGWEPSLAEAVIARGCAYVIAFRSDVFDDESAVMAREFYERWARYGLAPGKIPECFFQVAPHHEERMRPVLFGVSPPTERGLPAAPGDPFSGDEPDDVPIAETPLEAVTPGARWGTRAWELLRPRGIG